MRNVIFPSTVGKACAVLRESFTTAPEPDFTAGFTILPELPAKKTKRMITVRDDSGPDDGMQTRRRHGFNVWAETAVIAERAALYGMAVMRSAADGNPITFVDQMFGPTKVNDATKYVVDNVELTQYFFTCRLTARGSDL